MSPAAVIFDMDGVIVESEALWDRAREDLVLATGGVWVDGAQQAMMGMASTQWSVYVRDHLQVPLTAEEINQRIVERLIELYREDFPGIEGAPQVVRAASERWPLAVASSSNRELIDLVVDLAGIADAFKTTVSSEEAGRGKPEPDVFFEAARQLGVEPAECVVIEDSSNGIKAGKAAGMKVIAAPNRDFPPHPDALALADAVIDRIGDLTTEMIERV
jgi:HAD superfamily hydrolase (TIGR01509 family)